MSVSVFVMYCVTTFACMTDGFPSKCVKAVTVIGRPTLSGDVVHSSELFIILRGHSSHRQFRKSV